MNSGNKYDARISDTLHHLHHDYAPWCAGMYPGWLVLSELWLYLVWAPFFGISSYNLILRSSRNIASEPWHIPAHPNEFCCRYVRAPLDAQNNWYRDGIPALRRSLGVLCYIPVRPVSHWYVASWHYPIATTANIPIHHAMHRSPAIAPTWSLCDCNITDIVFYLPSVIFLQ